jgi:hypothetical protein
MIGNFQTSQTLKIREKVIPLFVAGHKNCLQDHYNNGRVSSVFKTEGNNISDTNVSDQSRRKYKEKFPLKFMIKAVCIRFSNLVILNTVSSQVRIEVCKCLFRNPSSVTF